MIRININEKPERKYTWAEIKERPGLYKSDEFVPSIIATFVNDLGQKFQLFASTTGSRNLGLCTEPEKSGLGWDSCLYIELFNSSITILSN